jgi:asparaginyl-tRNA synthetase
VSYREAITLLQAEIALDPSKWKYPTIEFGTDLATEHERWLSEVQFNGRCTFVFDYPRGIKSFYMRDNDDGETVRSREQRHAAPRRARTAVVSRNGRGCDKGA